MRPRRKYNGPCPEHLQKKSSCRHCNAYYMQCRYYRADTPPPEKKPDPAHQRRYSTKHRVVIYRGLHWPAPAPTEFT